LILSTPKEFSQGLDELSRVWRILKIEFEAYAYVLVDHKLLRVFRFIRINDSTEHIFIKVYFVCLYKIFNCMNSICL
jgi:hypothetical protein